MWHTIVLTITLISFVISASQEKKSPVNTGAEQEEAAKNFAVSTNFNNTIKAETPVDFVYVIVNS